jgi:hypothetical protein
MRRHSLSGLAKRRKGKTTVRAPGVRPAPDLVGRDSGRPSRTGCGWPISPRSRPGRASSTSPSCSTASAAGWSAGRWPSTCARSSSSRLEMAVRRRKPEAGLVHHSDQGSQGGFKWSSQRSIERSCDGQEKTGFGSCGSTADAFAGAPADRTAGASRAVLGRDRARAVQRGCRAGGGGVAGRWRPVVWGGWRDAVGHPRPVVGALSVVRRTGGDRDLARPRLWGAGDRASARSFTVDDLEGTPAERRDPGRPSGVRASTAQWHADRRARRPKPAKLAVDLELRRYVQDRLSGAVERPDGTCVAGPDVR